MYPSNPYVNRDVMNSQKQTKYALDDTYREQKKQKMREHYQKKMLDPEFQEKERIRKREQKQRKRLLNSTKSI
jgi:hypothetical protein